MNKLHLKSPKIIAHDLLLKCTLITVSYIFYPLPAPYISFISISYLVKLYMHKKEKPEQVDAA